LTGHRRVLSIDLETYSDVDLGSCGVYRYVEGDCHILLFAYAFLVKEGVLPFALTFAAFFLIYLIYESWMFLDLNKNKDK
jgi:hypothetical protein